MYDELIKNLRETDFSDGCPCGAENLCKDNDCLIWQAADAIEELLASCDNFEAALKDSVEECEELQGKTKVLEKVADHWCSKVPKWIPVTERLPEDRQRVLAINTPKIRPRSSYYRLVYFSNNLESVDNFDFEGESRCGFYYYDSEYGFCESDDVTHWMPLPQPPKDGEP